MNRLRVSILQTDIAWENKQDNLRRLREKLETLRGAAEIVVLPETFSTGFSMNTDKLAEPVTGDTITTLRQWASEYRIAIAEATFPAKKTPFHPRITHYPANIPPITTAPFSSLPKEKPIFTTSGTCSAWATKRNISRRAIAAP